MAAFDTWSWQISTLPAAVDEVVPEVVLTWDNRTSIFILCGHIDVLRYM